MSELEFWNHLREERWRKVSRVLEWNKKKVWRCLKVIIFSSLLSIPSAIGISFIRIFSPILAMCVQADAVLLLIDQHDTIFKLTFLSIFQNAGMFLLRFQIVIESYDDWMRKSFNIFFVSSSSHLSLLTFIGFTSLRQWTHDDEEKKSIHSTISRRLRSIFFFNHKISYDESAYLRMICNSPPSMSWMKKFHFLKNVHSHCLIEKEEGKQLQLVSI